MRRTRILSANVSFLQTEVPCDRSQHSQPSANVLTNKACDCATAVRERDCERINKCLESTMLTLRLPVACKVFLGIIYTDMRNIHTQFPIIVATVALCAPNPLETCRYVG